MKIIKNIALSMALLMPIAASAQMIDTVKKYAGTIAKTSLYYGRIATAATFVTISDITKVASLLPLVFATCTAGSIMGNALTSGNDATNTLSHFVSQIAQTDISFKSPFEKTMEKVLYNLNNFNESNFSTLVTYAVAFSVGSYIISRLTKTMAHYIRPTTEIEDNR